MPRTSPPLEQEAGATIISRLCWTGPRVVHGALPVRGTSSHRRGEMVHALAMRWSARRRWRGKGSGEIPTPAGKNEPDRHRGTSPATNGQVLATVSQSQCSAAEKAKASLTVEESLHWGLSPTGASGKRMVHCGAATLSQSPLLRNVWRVAIHRSTLATWTFPGLATLCASPVASQGRRPKTHQPNITAAVRCDRVD